jgi:hypothetical protein
MPATEAQAKVHPSRANTPGVARWVQAALLSAYWGTAYFALGHVVPPRFDPSIALDAAIPFVPWSVWVYLGGVAWIVAPLWLVSARGRFDRTSLRYALAMSVAFACFALLQTGPGLRAQAAVADLPPATALALSALHRIDPPTNLLPSLHVALAWLASWAIGASHRRRRAACALVAVSVTCAVLLTKQHTVLDAATGWLLALACQRCVTDQATADASPTSIHPRSHR